MFYLNGFPPSLPVKGRCMARSTSNGLVCGVEGPAGQDYSATRAMRPARPYPHVAGSRSVLVLQEQTEESFPGCSHPANTANAETRQAIGASLGRGVPCPSWVFASCTPQEGWKEPPGASLCSLGNQPGVSLCPQGSQLVSGTPGFKWGSAPSARFLVAVGNSSFSGASRDGLGLPLPSLTHTALSGHLPQGEPILA